MGQSKLTFLSLPVEVRERIYIVTGLVRRCAINLQEEKRRWSEIRAACKREYCDSSEEPSTRAILSWHTPGRMYQFGRSPRCVFDIKLEIPDYGLPGHGCIHDPLPLELLQISRSIREEAIALFYSKNKFVMNAAWLGRRQMSWLRLDLMTIVEIQLTTCSCLAGHDCPEPAKTYYQEYNPCDVCHYGCKRGSGKPLRIEDPESRVIVENWTMFCKNLKQNCITSLSEISVIADCKDIATALAVVRPLEDGFPVLDDASIRLGQTSGGELGDLARQTVDKLIQSDIPQPAISASTKLPLEVLELILQYTDLVTSDYISWFEPPLLGMQRECEYRQTDRKYQGLWRYDNKYHVCCVQCTPSREICACPLRHAAYSSHICRCWHFPKSLFLVNKMFYATAVKIFCSQNRFMLFEWNPELEGGENSQTRSSSDGCERLAKPIQFIQRMPPSWSPHIQWLKLRGTNFKWNEGLSDVDPDAYASWKSLTTSLKQLPRIDRLTIELDLSSDYHNWNIGLDVPENQEDDAWASLWNIVKLFKLPGTQKIYKDFFIRFDYVAPKLQDEETRWYLEKQMERFLMGEDYDAASRGKYHDRRQYNESLKPKRRIAYWDITMQLTEADLYDP